MPLVVNGVSCWVRSKMGEIDLPPKWRRLFGKAAGPLHSRGGHCSGATLYRVRDLDPRHVTQRAYFCCHKTPAAAIDLGLGCSNQITAPPFWGQVGLGRTLGDMDGGRDQGVPVEGRRLHQLQEGSVELTILTTLYGTFKQTRLQARDQRSKRAWRAFQSTQIAFTTVGCVETGAPKREGNDAHEGCSATQGVKTDSAM